MNLLAYSFPISIYRFHLFRFTGIMNMLKKGSSLQGIGGLIPRTFTIIIVYVINIIIVIFVLFIIFGSIVYLHYIYRCRCNNDEHHYHNCQYYNNITIVDMITMMSIIIIIVNIVTIIRCNIILTNPYFNDPKRTYSITMKFTLFFSIEIYYNVPLSSTQIFAFWNPIL